MRKEKTTNDRNILKSLLVLGSVVEARDAYAGGHIWRVSQFGKLIGRKDSLTGNDLQLIFLGGFLHDLGRGRDSRWGVDETRPAGRRM